MWDLLMIELAVIGYLWCYLTNRAEGLVAKEE